MTTTVELTDFELSELCEATHQPNAEAAIRTAMTEYLRSVRDCRRSAKSRTGSAPNNSHFGPLGQD